MGELRTGSLDRRITLQRATVTTDSFNNPVQTWATLVTVWASKLDVRDSERVAAKEVGAEIGTRFQIRWSETVRDLNPKDRLVYADRTYEIVNVKEVGRREGLEISALARID